MTGADRRGFRVRFETPATPTWAGLAQEGSRPPKRVLTLIESTERHLARLKELQSTSEL